LCNDPDAVRRAFAAKMLRQALGLLTHKLREGESKARLPLRWDALPADVRGGISKGALHSLAAEPDKSTRLQVVALLADLSQVVWVSGQRAVPPRDAGRGLGEWPELMPQLLSMLAPTSPPEHQSAALSAVGQIAELAGEGALLPSAAVLGGALQALLTGGAPHVRVESLVACGQMVKAIEHPGILAGFKALVPAMVQALQGAFGAGAKQELADLALQTMTEMVAAQALFFRDHLIAVATAMLAIMAAPEMQGLGDDTRALALEFLVALAECAGASVRKVPDLSATIISKSLENMAKLEEDPGWATRDFAGGVRCWCSGRERLPRRGFARAPARTPPPPPPPPSPPLPTQEDEENDENEVADSSRSALARLARAIGGRQAWELIVPRLTPLLQSTSWAQREAALDGLVALADGCSQYIALHGQVPKLVEVVLPHLRDAAPRVREAAVRALDALIDLFSDKDGGALNQGLDEQQAELAAGMMKGKGGQESAGAAARARKALAKQVVSIQDSAGAALLPALIAAAARTAGPPLRTRGLALSALISFLQTDGELPVDAQLMAAHEAPLMAALSEGLADFPQAFYASRTSAVQCLGLCAHEVPDFTRYYGAVVGGLQPLMAEAAPGGASEKAATAAAGLRAAAMLAAAHCMESVGKEVAGLHAGQLLGSVLTTMRAGYAAADEDSFPQACTVIGKVAGILGPDFAPFLGPALTLLTEKAVKVVSGSEISQQLSAASGGADEATKRLVAQDAQALMEKELSLTCMQNIIDAVPGPLVDHIDALLEQLAPGLEDRFPQVRLNTAELLTSLVWIAAGDKRGDNTHGARMAAAVFSRIVARLAREKGGFETSARAGLIAVLENLADKAAESFLPGYIGPPNSPEDDLAGYAPFAMPLDSLPVLFKELKDSMEELTRSREKLVRQLKENPDTDEVDVEELQKNLEGEMDLNDTMVNLVGYCIKVHKAAVLPILTANADALGHHILPFLTRTEEVYAPMRNAALCLVDDAIEHASPAVRCRARAQKNE
jgi:hypothetical protein